MKKDWMRNLDFDIFRLCSNIQRKTRRFHFNPLAKERKNVDTFHRWTYQNRAFNKCIYCFAAYMPFLHALSLSFSQIWHQTEPNKINKKKKTYGCTLPKINAGHTLIKIGLVDFTDSTLWKENANKWWIITFWPIFYWKWQWVRVLLGWIREFQITMHRYLLSRKEKWTHINWILFFPPLVSIIWLFSFASNRIKYHTRLNLHTTWINWNKRNWMSIKEEKMLQMQCIVCLCHTRV